MHSDATVPHQLDHVFRQACGEIRRRLDEGESAPAEAVLRDYSSLHAADHHAVAIVEHEWRCRSERGERPDLDSFCRRFPQWSVVLRRRLRGGDSSADDQEAIVTLVESSLPDGSVSVDITHTLNEHDLFEQIGSGGMGKVFCAFDRVLKRYVALKVIKSGLLAARDEVRRFYREAQTAAQLQHPHIVAIHGIGLHQGEHCFTMALATGGTLCTRRAEFTAPRAVVELVFKIADAVAHAHARGIIHRDLKPANILFNDRGEPLVSDFGLAKALQGSGELTLGGQVLGTPAYMSPEQAAGRAADVGPHSDVWSLGVLLYELLAGEKPFAGDSSDEVMQRVLVGAFVVPEAVRARLDPGLLRIISTCLTCACDLRYAHAGLLRDDLGRWLAGKPLAPPPQRPPQPRLWRRMGAALAAAALLVVTVSAATLALRESPATTPTAPDERPQSLAFPADVTHGTGTLALHGDGSVTLQSGEEAWVVLDTPPMRRPYRFTIEVQEVGESSGQVGIVWDFHTRAVADRATACYSRWTFSEAKRKRKEKGQERLAAWMLFEDQRRTFDPVPANRRFHGYGQQYVAFTAEKGRWRTLTIELQAGLIVARFDDRKGPVATFDERQHRDGLTQLYAFQPALNQVPPALGAGKFGLYCQDGSVRFRNPVVAAIPTER